MTPTTIQTNIYPFECISIDIQGPLPVSTDHNDVEYRYILSIIDIKSRWVELVPLSDTLATTISMAVYTEWLCRYLRPRVVLSDQGPKLKANVVKDLFSSYGISYMFITTYMATANSICSKSISTQVLKEFSIWSYFLV